MIEADRTLFSVGQRDGDPFVSMYQNFPDVPLASTISRPFQTHFAEFAPFTSVYILRAVDRLIHSFRRRHWVSRPHPGWNGTAWNLVHFGRSKPVAGCLFVDVV